MMDTVTSSWLAASHSEKVAAISTAAVVVNQNRRHLFQAVAVCTVVCLYMLLLLAWPHFSNDGDDVNAPVHVDTPRPETLGLLHFDKDPVSELRQQQHKSKMSVKKAVAMSKDKSITLIEKDDLSARTEQQLEPHLTLEDLFISVKTTKKFHRERLDVILKTWFRLARDQVLLLVSFILFFVHVCYASFIRD